jgi:Tat protein translocase TatB subunit
VNFLNIGPMELVLILALALIVLGPRRLPEVAKELGKALRNFRRATENLEEEISQELGPTTEALLGSTQAADASSQDEVLQAPHPEGFRDDGC